MMKPENKIRFVAWSFLISSILFFFFFISTLTYLIFGGREKIFALIYMLPFILYVFGAIFVFKRKKWARYYAIVLSFLYLGWLIFLIGVIFIPIIVVNLIFLFNKEVKFLFDSGINQQPKVKKPWSRKKKVLVIVFLVVGLVILILLWRSILLGFFFFLLRISSDVQSEQRQIFEETACSEVSFEVKDVKCEILNPRYANVTFKIKNNGIPLKEVFINYDRRKESFGTSTILNNFGEIISLENNEIKSLGPYEIDRALVESETREFLVIIPYIYHNGQEESCIYNNKVEAPLNCS